MHRLSRTTLFVGALAALGASATIQAQGSGNEPFMAGAALDQPANVRTYGSFRFAESISYDAERDLYVIVNAGVAQNLIPNDGYVSLLNPDATVHTLKWIGINRNGLELNHPLGSDIQNGMLYVADGTTLRWFDMETGEPRGSAAVEGATFLNDVEVASDGTIYSSNTGNDDPTTWRIYRTSPRGSSEVFIQGAPLNRPNGVAIDGDGNIVVVNIGDNAVLSFSPRGRLVKTEHAVDGGNDGLVILEDGTKYVSSVRIGTVSRIRPGEEAQIVAYGIPTAASMAYDSKRHRLLIPMNNWDAITLVDLD